MNRATSFELGHFPAVPSYRAHEESQTKDEHKQKKVHGRVVCRRARRCEEEKHYRQAACVPERKRLETEPPVLNAVGVGSASSSCVRERPAFACFPCSRYESIIGLGGMWWRKKKRKTLREPGSQRAEELDTTEAVGWRLRGGGGCSGSRRSRDDGDDLFGERKHLERPCTLIVR